MANTRRLFCAFISVLLAAITVASFSAPLLAQTPPSFRDGAYLVNAKIPPGAYRSTGKSAWCYWERGGEADNILDNHLGLAGGVVTIQPSDYKFMSRGCGTWVMTDGVGTPVNPLTQPAAPPTGKACPSGNVCLTAPANGSRVSRGNVVVFTGTANHPAFARYQFMAGKGGAWGHIADFNKPVVNGELMELHTDTLPAGTYTIRMQVIDTSGNILPEKADVLLTIQ